MAHFYWDEKSQSTPEARRRSELKVEDNGIATCALHPEKTGKLQERKKGDAEVARKNEKESGERKKVLTKLVGTSGDRQGSEDITYLQMTPKPNNYGKGSGTGRGKYWMEFNMVTPM